MSEEKAKRGTFIHGIAASEHLDSSGERIKVDGIDISSLTSDGVANYEHQSKEASAIVGKIIQAKKILKKDDCENDHHLYFWNKVKMPYLYVAIELFDAVGHQAAKDVAAMVRYDKQIKESEKDTKKLINFSIEGSKLDKKGSEITKCIARKVSVTITPCNKVCEAEELNPDDIENKEKIEKFGEHQNNFSFVQDLMTKNEGHIASCEVMEKALSAQPAITNNIGNISRPDKGFGAIKDATPKPMKPNYGKVIVKSKKKKVVMDADEAVDEHEKLVDVLESPSHEDDKKEAKKQKKELKEYKEVAKAKVDDGLSPEDKALTRKQRKLANKAGYTKKDATKRSALKQKMAKSEDLEKKEFFNRMAGKFRSMAAKRGIDRTAMKMQQEREAMGQEFDPEKFVMGTPDKVTIGSGKTPQSTAAQPAMEQAPARQSMFVPHEYHYEEDLPKDELEQIIQSVDHATERHTQHMEEQKEKQSAITSGRAEEDTVKIDDDDTGSFGKSLTAGAMTGAPSTMTGSPVLQSEEFAKKKKKKDKLKALKAMSDEAFKTYEKSEQLLDFLVMKLPNRSAEEIMSLAKTVAYVSVKKKEMALENLMKSKNVREQRKKVYGTNAMPSKGSKMHDKHMKAIDSFAQNFLGLKLNPSGGKINEATGTRRSDEPKIGTDKPDWRSGQLESQWNPDAAVHELAHLFLMPKGIGLEDAQRYMDKQYSDIQKEYGYMTQKRHSAEVQPMAAEQLLRRVMGLPATEHDAPTGRNEVKVDGKTRYKPRYEKDDPKKVSVEDPSQEIALRLPKSQMRQGRELSQKIKEKQKAGKPVEKLQGKMEGYKDEHHDLVRLSKLLSPENRQMISRRLTGQEKFHPQHGWQDVQSPDANINRRDMEQQAPEPPTDREDQV